MWANVCASHCRRSTCILIKSQYAAIRSKRISDSLAVNTARILILSVLSGRGIVT